MKIKKILSVLLSISVILIVFTMYKGSKKAENYELITQNKNKSSMALVNSSEENKDFIYLSDVKALSSKVSNGNLGIDIATNGKNISLLVDGHVKYFVKGIAAHASSTLIYDLKDYNYDVFEAYLGIDYSVSGNTSTDGAKFKIFVSDNNVTWTEKYISDKSYKATMDAKFVQIDIKGAKYLKLEAIQGGNNKNDYATYANAKLTKEGYKEDKKPVSFFKTVGAYDQIITGYSLNDDIALYELTLLQRTFIKKVGYEMLQALCQYSDDYVETLKWLMNDKDNLKLFLTGGKPEGAYSISIKHLTNLYIKHKEDLNDNTIDPISLIRNGEVYKKMMISLSLTHARNIGFWMDESQRSDAVVRYEVFKDLRINGKLENSIFDGLPVMDMRLVFNSLISDEQITWLNYHSRLKGSLDPYAYIKYTNTYNYSEEQYYSAENYDKWDSKYNLTKFNIPYMTGKPKLWVMFEEGSVCGGLSKTGTSLNTSRGIPALVLGQPGHAAYMIYSKTADGRGKWDLGNDAFGWAKSYWTYEGVFPTGWGTESWEGNYPASATLLSQAALDDLSNFQKAEEYMYLADVYKDKNNKDYKTLDKIYNKALDIQSIDYNPWKDLVTLYKNDSTKTEEDYLDLAKRIADALTYYPNPMFYLVKQLDANVKSDDGIATLTVIKNRALNKATTATYNDSPQPELTANLAKNLLGNNDLNIATFSFDGANAGKIILSSRFNDSGTRLKYSLDGGITWNETSKKTVTLTREQIESITAENDVLVGIVGVKSSQLIDITQPKTPADLYNNDLENSVIAATDIMEWSFDQITWTSFSKKAPDLIGDVTVFVRISPKGMVRSSSTVSLSYKEDIINQHQLYIPIKNLSIAEASSHQSGFEPIKTLDGNINTRWRSNTNDKNKFITIKLRKPKAVSALQYVPALGSENGNVLSGKVLVSANGIAWSEVAVISNWANDKTPKKISLENTSLVSYVKLVGINTSSNNISASMINLFQDDTLYPLAELEDIEGTYDVYHKAEHHRDLKLNIIKKAETIKAIILDNKLFSLEDADDLKELSSYLNIVTNDNGYQVTFLSSWLSTLSKGEHEILFATNDDNTLEYIIKVVDTYEEKDSFESDDKFGSIIIDKMVDATYELKIKKLQNVGEDISKFKDYLGSKEVSGNYDISIYDGMKKVSYDQSTLITLNIGHHFANQKIEILHQKNEKIEVYSATVDEYGAASFRSSTGLSQFLVLTDKKIIEPDPENPLPPEVPETPENPLLPEVPGTPENSGNQENTETSKKTANQKKVDTSRKTVNSENGASSEKTDEVQPVIGESNSGNLNENNSDSKSNENDIKKTTTKKKNIALIILAIIVSIGAIMALAYKIVKSKKY